MNLNELAAEQRRKRGLDTPPVHAAPTSSGATVLTLDNPRAQRWLDVKLQAQLDSLAAMQPDTGRNHTLNAIAYSFGRFIPRWLDEADTAERLYSAARQAGLDHGETIATIRSGLSKGMTEPRDPPISDEPSSSLADLVHGPVTTHLAAPVTLDEGSLPAQQTMDPEDPLGSWKFMDLGPYLDGSYVPPVPTLLQRADGPCFIYPSRVHWLSGEPEALKSWLGLLAVTQALAAGKRAIYLDLEDGPAGITSRLLAMGVAPEVLNGPLFDYLAPHEPLNYTRRLLLEPLLDGAELLIIDACTESLALQQLSPKEDVDVASWLALLPRWAARQGVAVLVLDHVIKDAETRGRWATGSQHKLAGLDGVAFTLEAVTAGGRGMRGRSRLFVSKDRHGEVRPHTVKMSGGKDWLADLVVDSTSGAFIDVSAQPPSLEPESFIPTVVMTKVSTLLASMGRPMTQQAIADRVGGRAQVVRQALAALEDAGHVNVEVGAKNSRLHTLIRPYPDPEEGAS